jgi:hypothetical protein
VTGKSEENEHQEGDDQDPDSVCEIHHRKYLL